MRFCHTASIVSIGNTVPRIRRVQEIACSKPHPGAEKIAGIDALAWIIREA
jgi:hypothetical protein